jgi:TP901 family phage tail tape measure protein
MTSDKALKLGFLLTATDQMSSVLEKAGSKLTGFQKKAAEVGANAMRVGGHLTTMGNQIAGGMLNMVKASTEYGDSMYKSAQKAGMNFQEFQKLAYAAKMAGVEQEALTSAISKFDKNIIDASKGTGEVAKAFSDLGIQLKDAGGKMRAQQDILADVANVFARVEDGATKTALAQVFLGEAGKDLIPLLNSGANGLAEMGKKAEGLNLILSDKTGQAFERFNDDLADVDNAILGFKNAVSVALIPVLNKIVLKLTDWISGIGNFVKEHQGLTKVIGILVSVVGAALFGFGGLALAIGSVSYIIAQLTKLTKIYTVIKKACIFVVGVAQRAFGFLRAAIAGARGATVAANAATRAYIVSQNAGVTASLAYRTGQALTVAAQWAWNGAVTAAR